MLPIITHRLFIYTKVPSYVHVRKGEFICDALYHG